MFSGMNPLGGGGEKKDTPKAADSGSSSKVSAKGTEVSDFNSSGLERAAKAAKDLERNSNAKEILRLTQSQEATKQKEHEAERAKYSAMQEELRIKRVAEEEAAANRTMEKQTQQKKAQADYQDQLTRRLTVEQMQQQKRMQEEEREKAEESLRRQEEIRKRTIQYEAELRQQTEAARVKAETEGRIKQERNNFDLTVDLKKVEAKELRDTVLESIKLAGTTIGKGLQELITDKEKLANVAGTITAVALGVYIAKTGTGIAGRFIEARLGKPSLVRETSKKSVLQMAKSPVSTLKFLFGRTREDAGAMKGIVLEKSLDTRLRSVAISTANTKQNRAPFRNVLLHGPPGTGKTMFAKGLARESGLHYAIVTGGDIAPLGKDAVTEIHKIFDWANATNKGVLLFIDEADAFLRKRSSERISEDQRNALNAYLYRTGEASNKVMVVYATNQPEQLDWAINDRIDEMVEFKLPGLEERTKMIAQYMSKYLLNPEGGAKAITVENIESEDVQNIAAATDGFSGREISKLAIAWQAAAYGTADAKLTKQMLHDVLLQQRISKNQKKSWLSKEEIANLVRDQKV